MAVLGDKEIRELLKSGKLRIEPLEEEAITSNGYDMLLEDFEIKPKETKVVRSKEKVKMPNDVISLPFLRTTYAFKGLILSGGVIDAGFEGHLGFALYNPTDNAIKAEEREETKRVIHLIFLKMEGESLNPFGKRKGELNNLL